MCARLQLLLTSDSLRVNEEVVGHVTVLSKLSRARLTTGQMNNLCRVLDILTALCRAPFDPLYAHTVNQNIIANHRTNEQTYYF